jgi:hypothetical protein
MIDISRLIFDENQARGPSTIEKKEEEEEEDVILRETTTGRLLILLLHANLFLHDFLRKKEVGTVTKMGLLLGYGEEPILFYALISRQGRSQTVFCCCQSGEKRRIFF